jgi:hypothetical protein
LHREPRRAREPRAEGYEDERREQDRGEDALAVAAWG